MKLLLTEVTETETVSELCYQRSNWVTEWTGNHQSCKQTFAKFHSARRKYRHEIEMLVRKDHN